MNTCTLIVLAIINTCIMECRNCTKNVSSFLVKHLVHCRNCLHRYTHELVHIVFLKEINTLFKLSMNCTSTDL